MTRTFFSLTLLALTVLPAAALAGGSLSRDDLADLIHSNPKLKQVLDNLELAETGTATRLGRHFGPLGGARVSPFEFQARVRGSAGTGFPLTVVLHADWEAVDAAGKSYGTEPSGFPPGVNLLLREQLVRLEIFATDAKSIVKVASTGSDKPVIPVN